LRKFFPTFKSEFFVKYKPLFAKVEVVINKNELIIRIHNPSKKMAQINFASLANTIDNLLVTADNKAMILHNVINIRNQYSLLKVFQSKPIMAKEWILRLSVD
jgi:hypothetical protein